MKREQIKERAKEFVKDRNLHNVLGDSLIDLMTDFHLSQPQEVSDEEIQKAREKWQERPEWKNDNEKVIAGSSFSNGAEFARSNPVDNNMVEALKLIKTYSTGEFNKLANREELLKLMKGISQIAEQALSTEAKEQDPDTVKCDPKDFDQEEHERLWKDAYEPNTEANKEEPKEQ